MSESFALPTKPEDMVPALVERFNSGKVSELMPLYEPEVMLVKPDGRTLTGHAEMAADLELLLRFGLPLKANTRHVFANDDIAMIILDWAVDGTGPDGKHMHFHGTASDVLRRGADGIWRYLIDNNQGTAVRQPA
ncbi:MAG TPA: nuclear transport factor 2 family protein [Actinomycetota bacterium]|nr:nuclear transport factor 2 family protein [Actinomycetota bacterium]